MRDYAELIEALRFAFEEQDCGECALAGTDRCTVGQTCRFKDAADAIEELLAAVPHWISVEERLPDDRRDVLCLLGNKVVRILKFSPVQTTWFPQGFSYEHNGMNIRQTGNNVTHWMPLPEPPKEDAE